MVRNCGIEFGSLLAWAEVARGLLPELISSLCPRHADFLQASDAYLDQTWTEQLRSGMFQLFAFQSLPTCQYSFERPFSEEQFLVRWEILWQEYNDFHCEWCSYFSCEDIL